MKRITLITLAVVLAGSSLAQSLGKWEFVATANEDWRPGGQPFLPIHASLLPDGSLLVWNRHRGGEEFRVARISSATNNPFSYGIVDQINMPTLSNGGDIFCAGHTILEDGKLFIAGGHINNDDGIKDMLVYDWTASAPNGMSRKGNMNTEGRWYPTAIRLSNGRIMVFAGTYGGSFQNVEKRPTLFFNGPLPGNGGTVDFTQATLQMKQDDLKDYYPQFFVDPLSGDLLYAGPRTNEGSGGESSGVFQSYGMTALGWLTLADPYPVNNVQRFYPSACFVDGLVIKSGGSPSGVGDEDTGVLKQAVASALYVDLNSGSNREWKKAGRSEGQGNYDGLMTHARRNHTLTVLADGKVLAMGGNLKGTRIGSNPPYSFGDYDDDPGNIANRAKPELWDPGEITNGNRQGEWKLLRSRFDQFPTQNNIQRPYHSWALLLPNAKVIVGGGEPFNLDQRKVEIFTPPYGGNHNWDQTGNRPTLNSVSSGETQDGYPVIRYGENFTINVTRRTNDPKDIETVRLVSLGSATHAYNQNQVSVKLTKSGTSGNITVTPPANPYLATPGPYMLFALDADGIPSVAKVVFLRDLNRVYPGQGDWTLQIGEFFSTTQDVSELLLSDNVYLGSHIIPQQGSTQWSANLTIKSQAVVPSTVTKLRLTVEVASSPTANITVSWLNPSTGLWSNDAAIQSTSAGDHVIVSERTTNPSQFVDSTGRVTVRVSWSRGTVFDAYLDSVEFGWR